MILSTILAGWTECLFYFELVVHQWKSFAANFTNIMCFPEAKRGCWFICCFFFKYKTWYDERWYSMLNKFRSLTEECVYPYILYIADLCLNILFAMNFKGRIKQNSVENIHFFVNFFLTSNFLFIFLLYLIEIKFIFCNTVSHCNFWCLSTIWDSSLIIGANVHSTLI